MRDRNAGKVYLLVVRAAVLTAWVLAFAQGGAAQGRDGQNSTPSSADASAKQDGPTNKPTLQRPANDKSVTISVNVKLVTLLATVRDKHGKIVPNLGSSDFTLLEDGKPVNLKYFLRESDLPLTAGLLVDTSMSQRNSLDQEKSASGTFFEKVLRDKDTAFLIHFDKEVELVQDLTSSRQKLQSSLESLHTRSLRDEDNSSQTNGGGNPDDSGRQRRGGHGAHRGGTTLYDAIYLASDELMKKQPGRKALIVLSDGVDRGSKESLESAIEAAQRSDTLVYSVLFKGEEGFDHERSGFGYPRMGGGGGRRHGGGGYPEEPRPDGKKILERISKETGGHFFEASKKEPIDQIYKTVEEELRNEYNLGFSPEKADTGGYHKIQLKTKEKDDVVQTRDGFYLGE